MIGPSYIFEGVAKVEAEVPGFDHLDGLDLVGCVVWGVNRLGHPATTKALNSGSRF